jgi:hypothetical protein
MILSAAESNDLSVTNCANALKFGKKGFGIFTGVGGQNLLPETEMIIVVWLEQGH